MHVGYQSLNRHMICKYYLPPCRLSFHFCPCWAKAFKFSKVSLVDFWFYFLCLSRHIQNNIASIYVKCVLTLFSFRSFMASSLTFRSLICFEFIFVYGVKRCSNFVLLHVTVQIFQHHLLERLSLVGCHHCLLCHKVTIGEWVYIWTFYPVPLVYIFFCARSILF